MLAPLNTYGATKAAADLALGAMAAEGLRVIRVRPFNHTGPGQSASFTEDWWLMPFPFPKDGQKVDLKTLSATVKMQTSTP